MNSLQTPLLAWYDEHARDLPWRAPEATPWGILVSEIMLQQTPVSRVFPVWHQWMQVWPTPADLAAAPSGEAVRLWGRLGYPRRALRLHAAAVEITQRFNGEVPSDYESLLSLPGIGDYTAAAVASFAFGHTHVVLDTNVRRVISRAVGGEEYPPASLTKAERARAASLLDGVADAPRWSVALMELGALVCSANDPRCHACPLQGQCAWLAAGKPAYDGPPRRGQAWAGTDRMVRGKLMAVLREAPGSVSKTRLDQVWPDVEQRERALATLVDDGLAYITTERRYSLSPD